MNTLMKAILLVLIGTLLASCGMNLFSTKTEDVADAAARIADFTLPEGYSAEFVAELAGYSLVSYNPGDGRSHLYLMLMQAPNDAEINLDEFEEALRKAQPGKTDRTTRLTLLEKRPITLRGEETTLIISEGSNGEGQLYRQAMAMFPGKDGPALVVIEEPINRWDEARIEAFLASIQ